MWSTLWLQETECGPALGCPDGGPMLRGLTVSLFSLAQLSPRCHIMANSQLWVPAIWAFPDGQSHQKLKQLIFFWISEGTTLKHHFVKLIRLLNIDSDNEGRRVHNSLCYPFELSISANKHAWYIKIAVLKIWVWICMFFLSANETSKDISFINYFASY